MQQASITKHTLLTAPKSNQFQLVDEIRLDAGAETAARDVGLGKAVKTMRRGEKSLIEVEPQYGYGSKGRFYVPQLCVSVLHGGYGSICLEGTWYQSSGGHVRGSFKMHCKQQLANSLLFTMQYQNVAGRCRSCCGAGASSISFGDLIALATHYLFS